MADPGTKELTRTKEKTQGKTKEPPMYRVILVNDHYTTMEFVVFILQSVFRKNSTDSYQIMMSVHERGSGVAGIYTREVAETKIALVAQLARQNSYPLKCTMEPA